MNGLAFHAWDQTSGANGALADSTVNGGTTAFSSATDTIDVTVTAVNDAPTATNLSASESYTEDTPLNLTNIVIANMIGAGVLISTGFAAMDLAPSHILLAWLVERHGDAAGETLAA